jgi:hypothetical protein
MKDIGVPTTLDTVWTYTRENSAGKDPGALHEKLKGLGNDVVKNQHEWQKPDDWLAYKAWCVAEEEEKNDLTHLFIQTVQTDGAQD